MNSVLTTVSESRHWLLTKPYASIDTEFKINYENNVKPYTIFAASIVDNTGAAQFRHITDFQSPKPEKELVIWLMNKMLEYRLTMGWYSKGVKVVREDGASEGRDSDLKVIDTVCKYYDIQSIIGFNFVGVPYVEGYQNYDNKFRRYYHVDLYQIYKKPLVKTIIYNNKYRSLRLDSVCKAIIGEGKLEGLNGSEVQKLSKEKQVEYVTQDAALVMKLSQHNNYQILDLMNAISTITGIPFEKICHTQISTWWKKIIENRIFSGECKAPATRQQKKKYSGGLVMEPAIGLYNNPVFVLDVKSLYPSMMISHNISFETVNCQCCRDKSEAMVSNEIMNLLNSGLPEKEYREEYWICKYPDYIGIVPRLLSQFREERFKQQETGNESIQLALKNLINGCYGIFGSTFFEFADYRVAELTTAFGRQAMHYMMHIGREVYGFNVIYGDTDSLFITDVKNDNDIMRFIAECSILLDIDIEQSTVYKKFLITKKKHYIGINQDDSKDPDIKGMEGIKSDRPSWINKIENQLALDIRNGRDPTINLKKEYHNLEAGLIPLADLQISLTLSQDPEQYQPNSLQRLLGNQLQAHHGDVIKFYKSANTGGGTSNQNLLSKRKYVEMLRTTVEDSLKVMGYDFDKHILGQRILE